MSKSISDNQRKNKIILALLLITPFMVMLAATVTYKLGYVPETQKNRGIILTPPKEIMSLEIFLPDGQAFDYVSDNKDYGRWHIFHFGTQSCTDKECIDSLWLTRQAHVALSHRAQHVQRYYISVGGNITPALQEILTKEHPRLKWLTTTKENYQAYMSSFENEKFKPLESQQFSLVDPNGWMMMYYPETVEGHDLIKDLKYLLKKRGK